MHCAEFLGISILPAPASYSSSILPAPASYQLLDSVCSFFLSPFSLLYEVPDLSSSWPSQILGCFPETLVQLHFLITICVCLLFVCIDCPLVTFLLLQCMLHPMRFTHLCFLLILDFFLLFATMFVRWFIHLHLSQVRHCGLISVFSLYHDPLCAWSWCQWW